MGKIKSAKTPLDYSKRFYRDFVSQHDLVQYVVKIQESDLQIASDKDGTTIATDTLIRCRTQLESFIHKVPEFKTSLVPLVLDKEFLVPIVRDMVSAATVAGVGPMAAVAGAVAEQVGRSLLKSGCTEVMVENGGDLFLHRLENTTVAIYAGQSPLSNKVGLVLGKEKMSVGVCTSSGKIGHSLSFGNADSVTVVASSTALADAVATRLGNEVAGVKGDKAKVERSLEFAKNIDGLHGVVIICGEVMGAVGDLQLTQL